MDLKKVIKIINLLKKKKIKISFAESCTGGKLSSYFTSVSGASKVFETGLITYSNRAKIDILKVPKQVIKKFGAVSQQCCLSMVKNLSKISKSKFCISITGVAGPNGGNVKKPVGLVFIGIKFNKKILVNKYLFNNKGRSYIQKRAVEKSLDLILVNLI
jgi:nicotinamide-nucleotide amidase